MADTLFVYGTLRPEHAPEEIADVVTSLRPAGRGTVRGRLYHFGQYPGAVLNSRSKTTIAGELYTLPAHPEALSRLDSYEEYRPNDPAGSLFKRVKTTVTLADGTRKRSWVYVYNQAVGGSVTAPAAVALLTA